jgi:HSP20 family protein
MTVIKFPEVRDFLDNDARKAFVDSVLNDAKFNLSHLRDFRPEVDIAEDQQNFIILMAVPGMQPDDFKIEVEGERLIVRGEREHEADLQGKEFHRREMKFGNFARSFHLPQNVVPNKAVASYDNGILRIELPKENAQQPVTNIKVKGASGKSNSGGSSSKSTASTSSN